MLKDAACQSWRRTSRDCRFCQARLRGCRHCRSDCRKRKRVLQHLLATPLALVQRALGRAARCERIESVKASAMIAGSVR